MRVAFRALTIECSCDTTICKIKGCWCVKWDDCRTYFVDARKKFEKEYGVLVTYGRDDQWPSLRFERDVYMELSLLVDAKRSSFWVRWCCLQIPELRDLADMLAAFVFAAEKAAVIDNYFVRLSK